MIRPPSRLTLFPYTTLFRSERERADSIDSGSPARGRRAAPYGRTPDVVRAGGVRCPFVRGGAQDRPTIVLHQPCLGDRKSTRLNSSHMSISYAVFCLKKKIE